jgi:hypothetical protein
MGEKLECKSRVKVVRFLRLYPSICIACDTLIAISVCSFFFPNMYWRRLLKTSICEINAAFVSSKLMVVDCTLLRVDEITK